MELPAGQLAADAVIINSESLRSEVQKYLDIDPGKLKLIYEAVDHELFRPGDADAARARVASHGVTKPYVLFVSSLWPYKNCDGLLRGWALARKEVPGRQLAIVGPGRDENYLAKLRSLVAELGIADDVVFVGGVPLEETVDFYRAADALLPVTQQDLRVPILEAMACGCPVVTSDTSAMPETAGGAAVLCDPHEPASMPMASSRPPGPAGTGGATPGCGGPRSSPGQRRARPPWTSTVRSPRTGGVAGHEGPRHRRRRIHRVTHL